MDEGERQRSSNNFADYFWQHYRFCYRRFRSHNHQSGTYQTQTDGKFSAKGS
ncbi:BA14K family protein [uncultured Nostoc sp.]|uniref:BA14K family protein n=1 Tax=uncultured Nostoc sp. TaxID=340711 RepID=UPI0035CBD717